MPKAIRLHKTGGPEDVGRVIQGQLYRLEYPQSQVRAAGRRPAKV